MKRSDVDVLQKSGVLIFGDLDWRGSCPTESIEQISFFNRLRLERPALGRIALHPRNEGLAKGGQFAAVRRAKAEGMTRGASDIIIPGAPTFVCEMKRRDHSKSQFEDGQIDYLIAAKATGAFACVALGAVAAFEALDYWVRFGEA